MEDIFYIPPKRCGKTLSIEQIKKQLMNEEPLISDEEAFLRHLVRKWRKK